MLKKISLLSLLSTAIMLTSCGLLPGMQNLETGQMRKSIVPEKIHVQPTLIPITPSLIADQRVSRYYYHVAPPDVLSINVWEHPEFDFLVSPISTITTTNGASGTTGQQSGYLVNPNGQIYFPLVGYITVGGKTTDKIREELTSKLQKYVPNPQIYVRVSQYRGQKVYVLGEVTRPGLLPINDEQLTIADALAISGGINLETANPTYIYVIRGDYTKPLIFWLNAKTPDKMLIAERFSLKPKDILYVSSAPLTRWNRFLSLLIPSLQPVLITQAIVA
ncbi:MAG: polysaccharide biosynthesis/export family protein [Legionellaceae bacterium]|nr:polysaccharide biosynthesis/export family protein [Legionellaceae bacterium]